MKPFLLSALLCAVAIVANALTPCDKHKGNLAFAKTTVADLAEDYYDVQHVKMDLQMVPNNTSNSGTVTTTAKVIVPQMDRYVFELIDLYTIDSVIINGTSLPVISTGDVHTVMLPVALPQNSVFTVSVTFHGQSSNTQGFRSASFNAWNVPNTSTLSEPYDAKEWWPCKQSLQDKIDSADIWITVPDTCKVGSNGLLRNVTPMPNAQARYEWHTNYATAYYLLSIAIADYKDYS